MIQSWDWVVMHLSGGGFFIYKARASQYHCLKGHSHKNQNIKNFLVTH